MNVVLKDKEEVSMASNSLQHLMFLEIQNSVCGPIPHSVLIRNRNGPSLVFGVVELAMFNARVL